MIKIEINIILSNIFYLGVKIIENFFIKYFFFCYIIVALSHVILI
jgi:hypothetical protein